MSSAVQESRRSRSESTPWVTYLCILIAGVLVVPLALAVAFNSWAAPDDAAYIRMAFATVAGQTISILAAAGLLIVSIARKQRNATLVLAVVTVIVIVYAAAGLMATAERLADTIG